MDRSTVRKEVEPSALNGSSLMRDGAARRRVIIRSAVEVFAERGYDGASLREIAGASGIQKGHLTYYYPSKDDILFEILEDLHEQFLVGISAWITEGAEHERMDCLRLVLLRHVELVCVLYKQTLVAYESVRYLTPERRRAIGEKRALYERTLGSLIDECRQTGQIAGIPTSLLTKSILGLMNWLYQWYEPAGRNSVEQLAEMLSGRALAAVCDGRVVTSGVEGFVAPS